MVRSKADYSAQSYIIKKTLSVKILFFFIGFNFAAYLVWIETIPTPIRKTNFYHTALASEALKNVGKDIRFVDVYRNHKISNELKYILLWSRTPNLPLNFLGNGQRKFLDNNCSVVNCYVTYNTTFFDDITKFHAVAFHGYGMMAIQKVPYKRAAHQKYIYFNKESADETPICDDKFDDFFNWTATHRLNSDIPYKYIVVKNSSGHIIGPKKNMDWERDDFGVDDYKLQNKSKAVAWLVSHCFTRSRREVFVSSLKRALTPYGHQIDVFGKCGTLQCSQCEKMIKQKYYFYLSLENSFGEDYVTEKILYALNFDVVPIVYGGADYSRFLPPGSYLDARKTTVQDLAAQISILIKSPMLYRRYFKWKKRYSFPRDAVLNSETVCAVCAALHNKTMLNSISTYKEFRKWWNPNYEDRCHEGHLNLL